MYFNTTIIQNVRGAFNKCPYEKSLKTYLMILVFLNQNYKYFFRYKHIMNAFKLLLLFL